MVGYCKWFCEKRRGNLCENGGGTPKVPPVPCRTRFRSGENAAVLNARAPLMRLLPLSAGVFHGLVRHLVVPVY